MGMVCSFPVRQQLRFYIDIRWLFAANFANTFSDSMLPARQHEPSQNDASFRPLQRPIAHCTWGASLSNRATISPVGQHRRGTQLRLLRDIVELQERHHA
jgi:hypothetical protein